MVGELIDRYNEDQRRVIDEYWEIIRLFTRKSGKVAGGVRRKELAYWAKFPQDIVVQALKIHMRKHRDKKEAYTRGIMREMARERGGGGGEIRKNPFARDSYGHGKYKGHYIDGNDESNMPF